MAEPLSPMIFIHYTDDAGTSWCYKMSSAPAAGVGNSIVARSTYPRLPSYIVPRHVLGRDTSGTRAKVVIGDPGNSLYETPWGNTWTGNNSVTYTATGSVGEKRTGR